MTTTFEAVVTSIGVKNAPSATCQERISGKSTSVPCSCVFQFWLPATICPRVLQPGRRVLHARQLGDFRRIVGRQRAGVALALPHAALREVAGHAR